jgi:cytochrome c553
MKSIRILLLLGASILSLGPNLVAQDNISYLDPAVAPSHREGFPLWAYGYIEPPQPAEDWSQKCLGTRPRDCDRPGGMPSDTSGTLMHVEDSELSFTQAEITAPFSPADWFPDDHPKMPDIVAYGREDIGMRACAICHLPNGQGLMQNAPVAGLPVDYFLQQLDDFATGKRQTTDTHKANGFEMAAMARALTPEQAREIAEYYGSIPFKPWVRVIESDDVPKFQASRNGLFTKLEGSETEPLGMRLIELPVSTYATNNLRNPRSGMVAYTPIGSLARGEALVTTGGDNSMECLTCHGADLRGTAIAPPIAGRQPSYIGRQLYDMQQGYRAGPMAVLMNPAVDRLTPEDIIAISAYVAAQQPLAGVTAQDAAENAIHEQWPDWAYGYFGPVEETDPNIYQVPPCPEHAKPRTCGPVGTPLQEGGTKHSLPGTSLTFTRAEANDSWQPADWYPGDHPVMPGIVATGDKERGIRPCALCHLPNGQGKTENGHVAGLPANYILAQLELFGKGDRLSADTRKANTNEMARIAHWLTEEEKIQVAEYFSAIPFQTMVRVVETNEAPQLRASLNRLVLPIEDAPLVPLGKRIVEVPENPERTEIMRDPRGTFIAYAPVGSVAKGEALATTGGGKTVACASCHRPEEAVLPDVPSIYGRTASYTMRQLWDIKQGSRLSPLMVPIVDRLTAEDMMNISAYLATQSP